MRKWWARPLVWAGCVLVAALNPGTGNAEYLSWRGLRQSRSRRMRHELQQAARATPNFAPQAKHAD
jgi:hypothetical protein